MYFNNRGLFKTIYLVGFKVLLKYFFLNFEMDLLIKAAAIPKTIANRIENKP